MTLLLSIHFDVLPGNQIFQCIGESSDNNIVEYLSGLSATEANCSMNAIISWDYTDPGNFPCDGEINIVITLTDACGIFPNQNYGIVAIFNDTEGPIELDNLEKFDIQLLSMEGKTIMPLSHSNNVSKNPPGCYFIKVKDENTAVIFERIVKF